MKVHVHSWHQILRELRWAKRPLMASTAWGQTSLDHFLSVDQVKPDTLAR